jgi:hypothetical protein
VLLKHIPTTRVNCRFCVIACTCRPSCLWIVLVTQGCKLLHLLGIRAIGSLTACLMTLAFTLPFIRTVTKYMHVEQEDHTSGAPFICLL